ncbi:hypothetical protein, partial [Asticcacaulis taihuensis]
FDFFMKFSSSRKRDLKWKIPVLNGLDFRGAGQFPQKGANRSISGNRDNGGVSARLKQWLHAICKALSAHRLSCRQMPLVSATLAAA